MEKLLELKNLKKHYPILGGIMRRPVNSVKAVDDIDLDIYRGECLGLVGESGCGKTTTGKAIVRLHDPTSGNIFYNYRQNGTAERVDIAHMKPSEMKQRGIRKELQMVFQDPTSSLDPRMLIKNIIAEPIKLYNKMNARQLNDRIAVMYLGKIVETAKSEDIFAQPVHPYTHALLSAIPAPDVEHKQERIVLTGDVPSPIDPPSGCRFHPRCPFVIDRCRQEEPQLEAFGGDEGHKVACHRKDKVNALIHDKFGGRTPQKM